MAKSDKPLLISPQDYSILCELVRAYKTGRLGPGPDMIRHRRPSGGGGGGKAKIYEVQNITALGDGIYNCYEQKVDATNWASTTEVDKLVDQDTDEVEIFNLLENYCEDAYGRGLSLYDRLLAWDSTDDEGTSRKVGVPVAGGYVRLAQTTEAAGASTTITCNLIGYNGSEITGGLGSGITVNCRIAGGGNLNNATPRLTDDLILAVVNIRGQWWAVNDFQAGHAVRHAFVKTTPGATNIVACYLDTDGTGTEINVTCGIHGGGHLDDAFPRLEDGDSLTVFQDSAGTWRCCTTFNYGCEAATESCLV